MPQPFDYGSVMANAAQLTNVYPGIQQALLGQQQIQSQQLALEQARQAQADQMRFQQDFGAAIGSGNPQAIGQILARYPKLAEAGKQAWDVYNQSAKQAKLIGLADVRGYLEAGDMEGARRVLQQHKDADAAAKMDTSGYDMLEEALNGADPKRALGLTTYLIASADPSKFAENLKALNPPEKTGPDQKQYEYDLQLYGKDYADRAKFIRDSKLVSSPTGVYTMSPGAPSNAKGGDLPTGGQVPGQEPLSFAQFKAYADVQGPEKAAQWATQNNIPISVETPGQAGALPKGVKYVTPDGKVFVR